jgi:hypothetical protein
MTANSIYTFISCRDALPTDAELKRFQLERYERMMQMPRDEGHKSYLRKEISRLKKYKKMKIEEIKKDLRNVADLETGSFEGEVKFNQGGNYILDTYYAPLAESYRELVEVLEASVEYDKSELNGKEIIEGSLLHKCITALSNAKKLINE